MSYIERWFAVGGWLFNWQTLVSGGLAIVAAVIGAFFVVRQTTQARRQEERQIQRKFNAARAVLPLTLSYLSGYARDSGTALRDVLRQRDDENIPSTIVMPRFPDVPVDVVPQLREVVEFGDIELTRNVVGLLGQIQVQYARVESFKRWRTRPEHEVVVVSNIEDYVCDVAEIYSRSSALFDFARYKTERCSSGLTETALISALRQIGFWQDDYPRLHTRILARIEPIEPNWLRRIATFARTRFDFFRQKLQGSEAPKQ